MADKPYSFSSFINIIGNNFVLILFSGIFLIGGFFGGSVWTENQILRGNTKLAAQNQGQVAAADNLPTNQAPEGPDKAQLSKVPEVSQDDHVRGNRNAKITLIEYSDFECPYCANFHPTMEQIIDEYGDQVAWVYRHFPLDFHPQAQTSAEASECVAELGGDDAFWKFTDKMITINQESGGLRASDIEEGVIAAGFSMDDIQPCLDSGDATAKVNSQMNGGATAGIQGTPGTILVTEDGEYELISGALPFATIKSIVDKYL